MKIRSLIFLMIFIGAGCSSQKKADMASTIIQYSAMSRGYYKKIVVQNQTVSVTNGRDAQPAENKIEKADWDKIVTEFEKINVEKLSTLKAPTEKRFHDGAAIGNLKITQNQKTYETQGFDNGFPPKEIEKLVHLLTDFVKE
ncbi:hypothetical protein DMB65_16395 [Flavobacterium cheongpyeongense]|uniref:Lipoprotein n=1 Tax=Flavobacterium cheongpyeongense TaxID=2212651 RepID=A0A2V4BKY3_9FLAO|nr:hypothetical protein [Flavobacterium cheongpyeongense]PXY39609.1 hypothetical protein DMB65_16395 [Flavobacterium cheongpyeongense]